MLRKPTTLKETHKRQRFLTVDVVNTTAHLINIEPFLFFDLGAEFYLVQVTIGSG